MASHSRPLGRPGLRGDAAADTSRARRAPLRAVPRCVPDAGRVPRGPEQPRSCGSGPGSGTTAAPCPCTAPRWRWSTSTPGPSRDEAALRRLPGVGAYTARAVRSFAFGDDVAAVDTNAVRVLSRCVSGTPLGGGAAARLGDRLVPPGESWEFNQAVFDLGATVCTGSRPAANPVRSGANVSGAGPATPSPTRGGPGRERRPKAPSPGPNARAVAACCTRCARERSLGKGSPRRAAGRTTRRAPSARRRHSWPKGSRGWSRGRLRLG